jgi:hypothetical protein
MTPEGVVKASVKRMLLSNDAYYYMPVSNGMGAPSLDFIGCHRGRFYAIETKAPGKKPTLRQEMTIRKMQAFGAKVFVIDGDTKELEQWLHASNPA